MGVVLSEPAYTSQAMQHAALLKSINRSPFGKPHWEFSVGTYSIPVDIDVKRAVHRLQVVLLFVNLDRCVHVLGVEPQMPAGFPEIGAADVRRIDKVVPGFEVLLLAEVFGKMSNQPALGMPQYQSRSNRIR